MTCSNSAITLLSLVIIVLALWPSLLSQELIMWITSIAGLLIIILVWTGCNCKWCQTETKKKRK